MATGIRARTFSTASPMKQPLPVVIISTGFVVSALATTFGVAAPSVLAEEHVDIDGLDVLEVLHALWKNSYPASYFAVNSIPPPPWDEVEAQKTLNQSGGKLDYVCGRQIKINFTSPTINVARYNRGCAATGSSSKPAHLVIQSLRNEQNHCIADAEWKKLNRPSS